MCDKPRLAAVGAGVNPENAALHGEHIQNLDGDWLCACGAFLCPPNDDRLEQSHQQHIKTVVERTSTSGGES